MPIPIPQPPKTWGQALKQATILTVGFVVLALAVKWALELLGFHPVLP